MMGRGMGCSGVGIRKACFYLSGRGGGEPLSAAWGYDIYLYHPVIEFSKSFSIIS